ncbi:substrate-binding domain-containing protein [Janibacter cremeus]|uniref:Branched-chain amino acid transport system substrate-binding protein n=1 Tax=Janibacter cremeus TaxID=1285192 RepID=A0A852VT54_9MICO|nr:substrate-binding domain-containing protein [Janibacter cremeus]NYF96771.1 branched-chain amino acid transport system substrate-binding protein [Janibacter cremeus]
MTKRWIILTGTALSLSLAACGTPGEASGGGDDGGSEDPFQVGLVYSKSGPLAPYGAQYKAAFDVGLDYATDGTGEVDGREIEISEKDDAGDPSKAVSAATTLIGQGSDIIAGSTSSGVALQVAPLAKDNETLFISGPAATDGVTGLNEYTFRSGRQTYQDVATAGTMLGDVDGKKVTVLAQDSAFGTANIDAVKGVLGEKGAEVTAIEAPAAAKDFTPFATKIKSQSPDLLFVAWAGENATSMWGTLSQQGVFDTTKVVTGLDIKATHSLFGEAGTKIDFLSHFFKGAADNEAYTALSSGLEENGEEVDLFSNDGFVAAQMIVQALKEGEGDTNAMIDALEGWTFEGPKGEMEIRAEDHAVLQPMFTVSLEKDGEEFVPVLGETVDPADVAPPVSEFE